jgi:hypothetical protein
MGTEQTPRRGVNGGAAQRADTAFDGTGVGGVGHEKRSIGSDQCTAINSAHPVT